MPLKPKKNTKISKNKYLKPGALAQIRYSRSTSKSCQVIGKKRILLDTEKENNPATDADTTLLSPVLSPVLSPEIKSEMQLAKLPKTPKTPQDRHFDSDSRLESLPLDLLVRIMCHLHHDQLRPVFHVSMRIRTAVIFARQIYFNYTTPDRSRQEMLNAKTPLPTEHWPFASRRDGKAILAPSPQTPKAPRLGPRPSRQHSIDMKQIAAVLFQETPQPPKLALPPGLPRPVFKSVASHRILFCEDELCQAVAQNKLM
ncbi:F-box protein [Rhynchospora pubera]|uniref:F-box protein n=1 Tax=Rhynchospora pubera TaxID=906938 RepID=A0AAV8EYU7_9POAL|nr:F-box protein [Rhynchospora pubera]